MKTLCAIFDQEPDLIEFLMAWNRRIKDSAVFFELMKEAGFLCYKHGKGLFSFFRAEKADEYLLSLNNKLES